MERTSESLLRRAAAGESLAMEELIRLHEPRLLAFLRTRMGPGLRACESAHDLLQDILFDLSRGVASFEYRSEPEFRGWLYTLAMRRIHDRARHHLRQKRGGGAARHHADSEALEELMMEGFSSVLSPGRVLQRKEDLARLQEAFAQLSTDDREILSLAFFCGMTSGQIAEKLGVSEEAARKRKNRAKARLAGLWGAE